MNLQAYGIQSELPETPLYHYSSPGGFLGIVKSKSIWMSNIRYQNDIEEYKYIFELTKKILKEEYDYPDELNISSSYIVPPIFTFSLSAKKDLLSQWRGYCPKGGYSFTFDKKQLADTIEEHKLEIYNCIYDIDLQTQIIKEKVIGFSVAEWKQALFGERTTDISYHQRNLWINASNLSPLLKHPSFKEEAEWRIIKNFSIDSPFTTSLDEHQAFSGYNIRTEKRLYPEGRVKDDYSGSEFINYREGRDTLIPYLTIPIAKSELSQEQLVRFSDVIVGPGLQQQLAVVACRALLNSEAEAGASVSYSKIPYREQ